MQKVKAFTLMELLVSMLISGIVISIIYLCYEIIYKQYLGYKDTNHTISQAVLLNSLLKTDFTQAAYITKSEEGLLFSESGGHTTGYRFNELFVLREVNDVKDTFFIPVREIRIRFQKEEQEAPSGLIDELSFDSNILDQQEHFQYHKQYGADVLMNSTRVQ